MTDSMLIDPDKFLFSRLLSTLISQPVTDLCRKRSDLGTHNIRKALEMGLARRLFPVLCMALTVELNKARESGCLPGGTPEERYCRFDSYLAGNQGQSEFFGEYDALVELVDTISLDWQCQLQKLFDRLDGDSELLTHEFGVGCCISELVNILTDCSDLHEQGSSVFVLQFKSKKNVVYKPRGFAGEILFKKLTIKLNETFGWDAVRTLQSLDRGSYGWQEWIPDKDCESGKGVENFYRRQGVNLALMYLLGGVDFHSENIIAHGSYPVIVDLETIMQPIRKGNHTLTRTGMVPVHQREFDYSALGFDPAASNEIVQNIWQDWGKDTLCLVPGKVSFKGRHCTPILNKEPVLVKGYAETVCQGFKSALVSMSRTFDKKEYADDILKKIPIRYIHRTTQVYHEILTASFHPANLESSRKRKTFIGEQLGRFEVLSPPELLEHEISVIESGCLPTCHTRADSHHLRFGETRLNHFFPQTAMMQLEERIKECGKNVDSLVIDLRQKIRAE